MSIETATDDGSMQDAATRLEALMFGNEDDQKAEPEVSKDDEVLEDEVILPEGDDSDSDEEDGSDGLDDIANIEGDEAEELTLASLFGIDDDRVVETEDGYAFNAIIDGETKQVPFSDLVADYQLKSHVNNKSIALENERKEFEEAKTQVATELKERVEGVSSLSKVLEEQLVGDYNRIDWDKLRVDDPANWTALRQEFAEKAQRIQQVQNLAREEAGRLQEEQENRMKFEYQNYIQEQNRLLIANNPEWADESKRKTDLDTLHAFVGPTYGFSDEELQGVSDHRLIKILQDAKAFREGNKNAETKRVGKKLPKFQKPGSNPIDAANLAKARQAKALKAKARKTGHVKDVAASILDRM